MTTSFDIDDVQYVAACVARHATTTVPRCADCRICQDCDVNVAADEYGDVRCETCTRVHERDLRDRNDLYPYA